MDRVVLVFAGRQDVGDLLNAVTAGVKDADLQRAVGFAFDDPREQRFNVLDAAVNDDQFTRQRELVGLLRLCLRRNRLRSVGLG